MRKYGTDREYDRLVEELEERDDVENPFALANWLLRRKYGSNPSPELKWAEGRDRAGALEVRAHGATLELKPVSAEGLDPDSGWVAWELTAGNDRVARFIFPDESPDAARMLANAWIACWAQDWD